MQLLVSIEMYTSTILVDFDNEYDSYRWFMISYLIVRFIISTSRQYLNILLNRTMHMQPGQMW